MEGKWMERVDSGWNVNVERKEANVARSGIRKILAIILIVES